MDGLSRLNELPAEQARAELARCCGASRWLEAMSARRPFPDRAALLSASDEVWWGLGEADWREAFAHHPKIGDREALHGETGGERSGIHSRAASGGSGAGYSNRARDRRRWRRGAIRVPCGRDAAPPSSLMWAAGEQAGVASASGEVLQALADGNRAYEDRFGYIFVVCATGKTAGEMLALLRARLASDPRDEVRTAAAEQAKITRIRLEKLLGS